ncbi:hypothetical protein UFOVP653_38 [uncultured Caudovirales phage]|uniref:Uncharacterized protein n=1 Tax=uncultured Caudovirales phage TaxID=2100421 RepID=A0A6J5N8Q1_9CAUD|nr:hypothetical protein UFOVP653_38 [uncultured Caudovirales phage]
MKLTYATEGRRAFILEDDGATLCEVHTTENCGVPAFIAAELVRKVNAVEALVSALQDVLHHPHIQAYLPYAPGDKVMSAAFRLIDEVRGVDYD